MKYCLSFVLLWLSLYSGKAQGYLDIPRNNSFDLIIGADYGHRIISIRSDDPESPVYFSNRTAERPKLAIHLGFNYNRKLAPRCFFKTGLRFTNYGFLSSNIQDFDVTRNVNRIRKLGGLQTQSSNRVDVAYHYLFLEIPTIFRYNYSRNWCKSYLEAGITNLVYLGTQVRKRYFDQPQEFIGIQEGIQRFNYLATAAIGAEMPLYNRYDFFVQMTARYQHNNLRLSEVEEQIFGVGFETGIRYLF